jgi:hypothetical protein
VAGVALTTAKLPLRIGFSRRYYCPSLSTNLPPALPNAEPAWKTYRQAAVFLCPALVVYLFSYVFLVPRLIWVWHRAGVVNPNAEFVMNMSVVLMHWGHLILVPIALALGILEVVLPAWPRARRRSIAVASVILNAAVLIGLAALCTAALIAAPIVSKLQ